MLLEGFLFILVATISFFFLIPVRHYKISRLKSVKSTLWKLNISGLNPIVFSVHSFSELFCKTLMYSFSNCALSLKQCIKSEDILSLRTTLIS